jgi:hypothetical protein
MVVRVKRGRRVRAGFSRACAAIARARSSPPRERRRGGDAPANSSADRRFFANALGQAVVSVRAEYRAYALL